MPGSATPPFSEMLHTFRVRAGMSQEALSEASGMSVRTISDLERGQRSSAHLGTIRLLASALDLTDYERRQLLEATRPEALLAKAPQSDSGRSRAESPWATSLPTPTTSLIGRTRELDELVALLTARSGEVVTLTGTGGVGKTRLSIELAHRLAPTFADGAAFVGLATVPQAELVPDAIARAFGTANTDQLRAMLATREVLVILDNLEHVIEAAPFVTRLNAECPNLTILATSRVPLRLSTERAILIPTLSLAERNAPFELVRSSDANQLFAERARRVDPAFSLSEQNASDVTEICQRLDGIPLAIELAASRLRVLTVPALLDRLERRLPVLTGGSRDLPPRQQSMRETIAWSYDLLQPEEKQFLRWMSVFIGGVSLESAEAIGRAQGWDADASLELVTTLIDGGMLYRIETGDGSPHFQLFETIREFGLEQLGQDGEMETARRFHAKHFLALVLRDFRPPYEPILDEWLNRIDRERPNVVQAFDFLCQPATAEQAMRFAAPMAYFWRLRGPISEGHARIVRAIELAPSEPSIDKAHLLSCAAYLLSMTPDHEDAYRAARAAVEVTKYVGSTADKAFTLQALASAEEESERFGRALPLFEEVLHVWQSLDNRSMQALCLSYLGGIHFALGDLDRAQTAGERSVELFLEIGELRRAAGATWYLGMFAASQGHLRLAAERYDRSLRWWLQSDRERVWFKSFAGLADVAAALGLFASAARMIGAVDEQLSMLGADLMPFDKPGYARAREACSRALDPEHFDTLVTAGRRLSPEEWLIESRAIADYARQDEAPGS